MEINTTEDFIKFLYTLRKKDEWVDKRSYRIINGLYVVRTDITDTGDLYDSTIRGPFLKANDITLTSCYNFNYVSQGYWNPSYVRIKDLKSGRCNILYQGYKYFTTRDEASYYIHNYRTIDKPRFLMAMKSSQKNIEKEIRSYERNLKSKQKKLAEIQRIIAENDRTQ